MAIVRPGLSGLLPQDLDSGGSSTITVENSSLRRALLSQIDGTITDPPWTRALTLPSQETRDRLNETLDSPEETEE